MKNDWLLVSENNLPPLDEIVWLWDGKRIWIGGCTDDGDGWLWGNTCGRAWHTGTKREGKLDLDDYKPTHWLPMPQPPREELTQLKRLGIYQCTSCKTTGTWEDWVSGIDKEKHQCDCCTMSGKPHELKLVQPNP